MDPVTLSIILKVIEIIAVTIIVPLASKYLLDNIDSIKDERKRGIALIAVKAAEELKANGRLTNKATERYAKEMILSVFPKTKSDCNRLFAIIEEYGNRRG